jgi:hypothetical protein
MTHIGQEVEVIGKPYPDLLKEYTYTMPYEEAKLRAMDKLIREANLLRIEYGLELPKGIPKMSLSALFPGEEGKIYRDYYSQFLAPGSE